MPDFSTCAHPLTGHARGRLSPMRNRFTPLLAGIVAFGFLGLAQAQSVGPFTPPGHKAATFSPMLDPDSVPALRLELPPLDEARVAEAKRANSEGALKRLQIGVGRETAGRSEASSAALS